MSGALRILYHHRTQGRGAEGNHIVSIVTGLRALGHEVDVLSPAGVDPFDPQSSMPVDKAQTHTRGWSRLWKLASRHLPNAIFELAEIAYNVPAYLRLRRALRARRYDLVVERYAFFLIAGVRAAHEAGCKFILEANEVSGIPDRARKQSFARLCAAFERHLVQRCDLVHTVSSYLGERVVRQGVPAERVAVVPNGFELSRLRTTRSREEMRQKLGFGDDIVIGFAGWFDHWDRLDFLLDVFGELHRRQPRARLCLVGGGPVADEVRRRGEASEIGARILWTGPVPRAEVYDYLQTFDIGVLPHSNLFGSPMVMFEMMGLKIPLALPRVPPVMDVHGAGSTAVLFEPLNAAQCLAALEELASSQSRRLAVAEAAYAKLIREHPWRHTAELILAKLPA